MDNNSTSFYDEFASKYDVMIPDERYQRMIPFFIKIFQENKVKTILDCASGTGKHAIAFSKLGYKVEGCDSNPKMVEQAKINAHAQEAKVNFIQADFKKLAEAFSRKFDCVICVGNSLSHELEDSGVMSALRSINEVLNDGGTIIVQIRNLPKLIKNNTRIFPVHHQKEPNGDVKLFFYVLDFDPSKVTFNVVSYIEENGIPKFNVYLVDYNIMAEHELVSNMAQAGFKELTSYGSFKFEKFDSESENIIVVGRK